MKNDIKIDSSTVKMRYDGAIILVDCFDVSNKSPSLNDMKGALKEQLPNEIIEYLEHNNFKKEGEGKFGTVYSSGNIVLKISKKADPAYEDFANFCLSNKNKHFPKLGKIRKFKDYYIYTIEKLKDGSGSEFDDLVLWMENYAHGKEITQLPKKYEPQRKALEGAIDLLSKYQKQSGHNFDLHSGNVMLRGDTVVIVDPFVMEDY